jgi:hypothetical protein
VRVFPPVANVAATRVAGHDLWFAHTNPT